MIMAMATAPKTVRVSAVRIIDESVRGFDGQSRWGSRGRLWESRKLP